MIRIVLDQYQSSFSMCEKVLRYLNKVNVENAIEEESILDDAHRKGFRRIGECEYLYM